VNQLSVVAAWLVVLACTSVFSLANAHYPSDRSPLQQTPFVALPLGSVHANGWLLKQLQMQREGLTGHAEQVMVELNETSAWRGGDKDNWERSPYYVKGLVALAYTLDDPQLKKRAQVWIDWCLGSQRPDGLYGPSQNDDWWPRMVSNYFLRDYYDATADPRVLPFLRNYYHYMLSELPRRPLRDWAKSRAGDDMDTAIWLYNRTGDTALLDLVDLLRKQAYDWPTIMTDNTFMSFGTDFQPRHNVNIAQAMKMPIVSWQRTGDARERSAIDIGYEHLMREHGLAIGMQSGTEFLAGRSPSQGVEFCAIVEQMLSEETILRITGDAKWADRLEQLAYNALPAAWNRDLTALRYYTLPNHVIARRGPTGFGQNYDNGLVYGPRSGYPCCCFNVHQGWPKLVQNSWAATGDNGLAVVAYAPTTVTAKVGEDAGATATIAEETRYPFDEEIRFKITVSAPAAFPLALRTPQWCDQISITVNGQSINAAKPGEFVKINRQWNSGDEVVVRLPMKVRIERGVYQTAVVHRGPLIFSLRIHDDKHVVDQAAPGIAETEEIPASVWNYALSLQSHPPAGDIELLKDATPAAGDNPFTPSTTPVKLQATARPLPQWDLAWNGVTAAEPPGSPAPANTSDARVTLIPFGAEDLRVTNFPVVGQSPDPIAHPLVFKFDQNEATGWTFIGGDWWAHDGQLRTTNTGGAPGFKALLESVACGDLRIDADVTPPPTGDAGVIFRVNKPSIGPDAYEGYYAGVSASGNQVILGSADGRSWTPLKIVSRPIAADHSTKLSVTAVGNRIEVRVNDEVQPTISFSDSRWTSGQIGLRMYTIDNDHAVSAFGNVGITPTPASPQNQ
jgi:hypothetical protein